MLKTIFISLFFVFHPVHVALTSIDYVPENKSFKVYVRLFYDDFLRDFKLSDCNAFDTVKYIEKEFPQKLMEKYINYKLAITADNHLLPGDIINLKISDNEANIDMIYMLEKRPASITVRNSIMTDLYDDMANMTIIKVENFEEGIKFTSDIRERTFNIK